jgi:hypothetical protein
MLKYSLSNENRSKRSRGKQKDSSEIYFPPWERETKEAQKLGGEGVYFGLTVNQNEIQHLLQVSLSICVGYVHTKLSKQLILA